MRNKKLVNESMGAKPKERSKTGIARKLAMGVPLVASASGVKGGRGANRAFGAITGITAAKSGVKVDPLALAMALPVGKLIAAVKALKAAGKIKQAEALAARVAAKTLGGSRAAVRGVRQERTLFYPRNTMSGSAVREISESVYPRQTGMPVKYNLADEYAAARKGYEKVFGKGAKVSSFNPDLAAMTGYPGRGGSLAEIRKISNQVDAYLAKRKLFIMEMKKIKK